jgi:hypothetical protein
MIFLEATAHSRYNVEDICRRGDPGLKGGCGTNEDSRETERTKEKFLEDIFMCYFLSENLFRIYDNILIIKKIFFLSLYLSNTDL